MNSIFLVFFAQYTMRESHIVVFVCSVRTATFYESVDGLYKCCVKKK